MFCPECGTQVDNGKFCPNCGATIEQADQTQTAVSSPLSSQSKYSIDQFVASTLQKEGGNETFELENEYMLDVNLDGRVWTKIGSMIAYTGNVKFKREGTFEHGLDKFVKKAVTGEATTLMKAEGQGHVYMADQGKKIIILKLENDRIFVNGNDMLAFEDTIDWDIKIMTRSSGMMSGGLFNIRLEGTGMVALTTYYTPMTLKVTPEQPIMTDPNATVAWSGGLSPDLKTNIDFKTLLGKDSGETFQMKFQGNGFVIVQPFEEY